MALVGDVIVGAREAFPDPSALLPAPSSDGGVGSAAGGTLPAATYYWVVTALNQWGETLGTAENSYVAGGATSKIVFTPVLPIGAVSFRVYIGTTPGSEQGYFNSVGVAALTVTTLTGLIAGAIPTRSSAMNPDADGGWISASTAYRWLNDALTKAGRIGGGIPSITALQAVAGTAMYRLTGRWIKFTDCWFDGWPINFGKRKDVFLHNPVISIPGTATIEEWTDSTVFQLWGQPNRTGASTVLGANMTLTDTSAQVANNANFIAPGLCQIDNEIMAFSSLSGATFLAGMMRGLGGTVIATHLSGATVVELNIRISGFRQPSQYSVGQSALSLPIVTGWEVPLQDYMVAQARRAEQNTQEAIAIESEFNKEIGEMAKNFRGKTGPRQVGGNPREVYGGSVSGGIILL